MINPEITVEEIIDCYEKIRCLGVVSREEAIATVSSIAASDIISAGNFDDDNAGIKTSKLRLLRQNSQQGQRPAVRR